MTKNETKALIRLIIPIICMIVTIWAAIVAHKNNVATRENYNKTQEALKTQIQLRQLDSSLQRLRNTMTYGDSVIQRTKKAIQGMDEVDRRAEELDREFNKVMRRANNNRPFPQQGAGQ